MPHTHTHIYAWLHKHTVKKNAHSFCTHLQEKHTESSLFPCGYHPASPLRTRTYRQDGSLGSCRYAEESERFLQLNAAHSELPVKRPDHFIMNLHLSSRAVGSDRSLGLTNTLGYFWQRKKPTKHGEPSH